MTHTKLSLRITLLGATIALTATGLTGCFAVDPELVAQGGRWGNNGSDTGTYPWIIDNGEDSGTISSDPRAEAIPREFFNRQTAGTAPTGTDNGTPEESAMVGTWSLTYAQDSSGAAYDLGQLDGTVQLVVTSASDAVLYYFGETPYSGTLIRMPEYDYYFTTEDYLGYAYALDGSDGTYWDVALITSEDGSFAFWHLAVGRAGSQDLLALGSKTSSTDTPGVSVDTAVPADDIVGTWTIVAAYDEQGEAYDLNSLPADAVVLDIRTETRATFYYFDNAPFSGTLSRDASLDAYYATDGYNARCYLLTDQNGDFWEFAYLKSYDTDDAFFYLELGAEDRHERIYLARTNRWSSSGNNADEGLRA